MNPMARGGLNSKSYHRMDNNDTDDEMPNSSRGTGGGRIPRRLKWRSGAAKTCEDDRSGDSADGASDMSKKSKGRASGGTGTRRSMSATAGGVPRSGAAGEFKEVKQGVRKIQSTGGASYVPSAGERPLDHHSWTGEFPSEVISNRGTQRATIGDSSDSPLSPASPCGRPAQHTNSSPSVSPPTPAKAPGRRMGPKQNSSTTAFTNGTSGTNDYGSIGTGDTVSTTLDTTHRSSITSQSLMNSIGSLDAHGFVPAVNGVRVTPQLQAQQQTYHRRRLSGGVVGEVVTAEAVPEQELNMTDLERFHREQRIEQFEAARERLGQAGGSRQPQRQNPPMTYNNSTPLPHPYAHTSQAGQRGSYGLLPESTRPYGQADMSYGLDPSRQYAAVGGQPPRPPGDWNRRPPAGAVASPMQPSQTQQRPTKQQQRTNSFQPPQGGASGRTETEEQEALRLAMEMSLRSFEDHEQERRKHERLMPATTLPSGDGSETQLIAQMHLSDSSFGVSGVTPGDFSAQPTKGSDMPPNALEASIAEQMAYARQTMSKEEADAIEAALRSTGELDASARSLRRLEMLQEPRQRAQRRASSPIRAISSPVPDGPMSASTSVLPKRNVGMFAPQEELIAGATHLSEQDRLAIEALLNQGGGPPPPDTSQEDEDLRVALELQQQEAAAFQMQQQQSTFPQQSRPAGVGVYPGAAGAYHSSAPAPRHPLEVEEEERQRRQRDYHMSPSQRYEPSIAPQSGGAVGDPSATYRGYEQPSVAPSVASSRTGDRSLASAASAAMSKGSVGAFPGPIGILASKNVPTSFQERAFQERVAASGNDSLTDVDTDGEQSYKSRATLESDAEDDLSYVSGKAFNVFQRSVQKRAGPGSVSSRSASTRGSVETRESARSAYSRSDGLEPRERMHINRAITGSIIGKCNGAIKEGKEAVIFHAYKAAKSEGHDVAIKVVKRIEELRKKNKNEPTTREQLIYWAEREHQYLKRACLARVPVPSPLLHKENLIFMRFMGEDRWPAPQLKDVEIKRGSTKWGLLYSQIMVAIRRLYVNSGIVHGDLSEYNVLVAPSYLVENKDEASPSSNTDGSKPVQACLIDFSRAVDVDDPDAHVLLEKDLTRIRDFFHSKGTKTLGIPMAIEFVVAPDPEDEHGVQDDVSDIDDDEIDDSINNGGFCDDEDKGSEGDDESGDHDDDDGDDDDDDDGGNGGLGYYSKYQTQNQPHAMVASLANKRSSSDRTSKRGGRGGDSKKEGGNRVLGAFPQTVSFGTTQESQAWEPEWEEAVHFGPTGRR